MRPSPIGPLRPCALLLILAASLTASAADVPRPEQHLGYRPGDDFHLTPWAVVVEYFEKVGEASDRVEVVEIGTSTEGRPLIVGIISAPETINNLDNYKELQRRLADPTFEAEATAGLDPITQSKTTILITCTIHSSETASTLMSLELLHDLATKDDPATIEALENTILLLVPSVNPDGVDIVHDWYERSKGKPWEGSGMPWLYHIYAGHDTNRDWFMLNLVETQVMTRFLYEEWFPTITWDVHQMGNTGPRLFVPPFFDPVNPNLHPRVSQGIFLIGAHMAADLAAAGKQGVATNAMYDNWWNGGNRTVPQRHNMVGILTEAASVKLASPIFQEKSDLRGGSRGFPNHDLAVNFVDPWPGGWWRLRDIIDYELIAARSLLTLGARYREWFQKNYREMAEDAIQKGLDEPPYAWVVPSDQRDPGTAAEMVRILKETGIKVHRAQSTFEVGGIIYPEGSYVFLASQPYRPHLKDMMERQVYPDRIGADGTPERPYDVAGWTLPIQMGVKVATIAEAFDFEGELVETVEKPEGRIEGADDPDFYVMENQSNDDFRTLNALIGREVSVGALVGSSTIVGEKFPAGALLIPAEEGVSDVIAEAVHDRSTRVLALKVEGGPEDDVNGDNGDSLKRLEIRSRRIGLYKPWVPSMDEGWTRLVLEKFDFPYETLHDADIRAGELADRIDVLLIPSVGGRTLRDGYAPDRSEPAYVGGLGQEGINAIRDFVEEGGTLVCLENSCPFAISEFDLPVKEVIGGLRSSEFYGPGSVLRLEYAPEHPLAFGMPAEGGCYFSRSLGFEVDEDAEDSVTVAARYASARVLESGWLLGAEHLQGKAALVEVPSGNGRVILFAFPPQHRGQPHATFRLLFNALLLPGLHE
ncbi:M14 family metallopeptidase [soil metagenome]